MVLSSMLKNKFVVLISDDPFRNRTNYRKESIEFEEYECLFCISLRTRKRMMFSSIRIFKLTVISTKRVVDVYN